MPFVALNTTVWLAPTFTVKGELGVVLTPAGNPVTEMVTGWLKPLIAFTESCKLELPAPIGTKMDDGDTFNVKSAGGGAVIDS